MRPTIATATSSIAGAVPDGDGYAALTRAGLERFDAELQPTGMVRGGAIGNFEALAAGRFVSSSSSFHLFEAEAWSSIETGGFLRQLVIAADRSGFFALGPDRVVIDRAGTRTTVKLDEDRLTNGAAGWRDGLVLTGHGGLTLLDGSGTELVRSGEAFLTKRPVVVGDHVFTGGTRGLYVFDAEAREVAKLDLDPSGELLAFAGGVLVHANDTFTLWGIENGAPIERWQVPDAVLELVVGDHLVLSDETGARLVDADGAETAIAGLGLVRDAAVFEDGLALATDRALVRWSAGRPVETLEHDLVGHNPCTAPAGLITTELHALYLWRTERDGVAPAPVATDLPIGVPIVRNGIELTIESAGRVGLRARGSDGERFLVEPTPAPWRPAATRDEATQIVQRLISRVFDGPIPNAPSDGTYDDATRMLAQLPLAETMDLYGRSWFAQSTLAEPTRPYVLYARKSFLAELATALGTKPRLLAAAIRARKLELDPPKPVTGYDYVGTFTTSGALVVSDPCYLDRKPNNPAMGFSLSLKLAGLEGLWHAFIRSVAGEPDRNAELAVVHETAFAVYASEVAGTIGVDGGCAGVYDKAYRHDRDLPFDEGVAGALGAAAWSGYGDGMYPVLIGRLAGKVAKVRIVFIDDVPEVDRLIAKTGTATKPYSASAKFVVGDTIAHVKFGTGSVIRAADGKIDVSFADGMRTLVAKK